MAYNQDSTARARLRRICSLGLVLALLGAAEARAVVEFGTSRVLDANAASDVNDDINPDLVTDGQGNWLAVWWTTTVQVNAARLGETRFSRSTDDGASWSESAPISTLDDATRTDARPRVATDGAGNWVAAWLSNHDRDGANVGGDIDILVARSSDAGATWSDPIALNTNAASDSGADFDVSLATDRQGTWIAAWDSNEDFDGTPALGTDSDILFARSTNNGATWTAPAALNTNADDDNSPAVHDTHVALATDGAGNWVAVWQSSATEGFADVLMSRSTDNGVTWSAIPSVVSPGATLNLGPYVLTDGAGVWLAVWASDSPLDTAIGRDFDILVRRSTDAGVTWSLPVALNSNAATDRGADGLPYLATDGGGTWVATWASDDSLGGTIGRDYDSLYAESTDGGMTWSAAAALNTNAACDVGDDFDARVATDGEEAWIAVRRSSDPLGDMIGRDFDILIALPDVDPTRCQSRNQQACANALNADYAKLAKAKDKQIARCVKNQIRSGASATACLALPDTSVSRAIAKTETDEAKRCVVSPPDFGPLEADAINEEAVAGELATLAGLFGPDLDAALVSQAADADAAACQRAVLAAVHKCQAAQLAEFNRCKKNSLKKGGATDTESLARCLGFDPRRAIAKKCDPTSGELATRVLPRKCLGIDLSERFPACGTDDAGEVASCVDRSVTCSVCLGLSEADELGEDCDLFDDGAANASCQ